MINFYNHVPLVYTSASRDFQYLSWLVNVVLNSVKHNVDDMYYLPNTKSDIQLTELLAMTLGFKVKRNYDKNQLVALVSALPSILKYKGTKKSIEMAANALVDSVGSLGDADVEVVGAEVIVTLPRDLSDITLFLDLLDYILPAGMTCHIKRKNVERHSISNLDIGHRDIVSMVLADDIAWPASNYDQDKPSLSTLYNVHDTGETSDNRLSMENIREIDNKLVLNTGLLDSTVIPVLADRNMVPRNDIDFLYSTEPDNAFYQLFSDGPVKLMVRDDEEPKEL